MPIYEYICNACDHALEALQKMSDAPLIECPACSKPSLKKKISAAGFRLSGSGWYETDFKSTGQKNLVDSDTRNKESAPKQDTSGNKETSGKKETPAKKDTAA
ncbi:MAG: zinc ribbon domain-containing protein [Gammaproteobacteria bacterium]